MPIHHNQPTFSGGEFAPSLHPRVDLARYPTGLKKARNCFIHPHGGCSNRPGLRFIAETRDSSKRSRLIDFVFSTTQAYAIEFGEGYCRFFRDRAPILATAANRSDYSKSAAYAVGDWVKVGKSFEYTFFGGGSKRLYVHFPYDSSPASFVLNTATAASDTLSIHKFSSNNYEIRFANATASKNTAALIQTALLAADAELAGVVVTGNATYTATPTIIGGSGGVYTAAFLSRCIAAVAGGESRFPRDTTESYWSTETVYQIATDFTEDEVAGLEIKVAQSADVLYIAHPDHPPKTLTRTDHDVWVMEDYDFSAGPFMAANDDEALTITMTPRGWFTATAYAVNDLVSDDGYYYICAIAHTSGVLATDYAAAKWVRYVGSSASHTLSGTRIDVSAASALFNAGHVGALWQIRHEITDQLVRGTFTATNQFSTPIKAGTTWRYYSSGTWTGKVVIQKSTNNGVTWQTIRSFSSNVDTYGDTGESQCLMRVGVLSVGGIGIPEAPPAWTGTAVVDLSSDPMTWIGIIEITAVTNSTTAVATVREVSGPTRAVWDWSEGSWSDYRGWPSCVAFYADRLWWACTEAEANGGWGSEIEQYGSFARHSPLVDSDGVSVRLGSQKVNAVRNLVPLGDLLALTSGDDWVISGSNGIISPTTTQTRPQGFRGSAVLPPIVVGNRVVIVSPKGQVVRDLGFGEYDASAYSGGPISIMSAHLFQGYEIIGMAYAQEPDSLIWFVRDDGALLSLTYLPEHEVLAWTRHDTDGEVESICSVPGATYDEIWVIVKRTIDGSVKRFVECLAQRLPTTNPQDQFFVDCGLSLDSPITITGITAADPVVVTAPSHGLSNGNTIDLSEIEGLEIANPDYDENDPASPATISLLNGHRYKIADKTDNTFELTTVGGVDIDGSAASDYESGGEARLVVTSVSIPHLSGEEVAILANGVVLPRQTATGGNVSVPDGASRVHVGLPYTMEMETLNIEIPQRDGTMQGRKAKIGEVIVRVQDSMGGKFGPSDGYEMSTLVERELAGAQTASPAALFTGEARVTHPGGWEDAARILIQQEDPLPLTVLALIPRVTPGGA